MLSNNHVRLTHALTIRVIHILTMQQNHHIRILLNRTRLTQIRNHRTLISTLLRTTVQLRQRNHRNIQLLSQQLQATRELRNLLLTRLNLLTRTHQLQVVQHHKLQIITLLEATALRANLHQRHIRRIINKERSRINTALQSRQVRPALSIQVTLLQTTHRNLALRRENTHRQLSTTHLQ